MPSVGIVLGSKNDLDEISGTKEVLDDMGVEYEVIVASAHRDPAKVKQYVESAPSKGVEVLIGAAGGSAALPGTLAAWSTIPVIGIPLTSSELNGLDSLYSIAQMPPGVPVACVAIGSWGARNAAFLATQILGLKYQKYADNYKKYRDSLKS
jgi:5-(carboxyamino)imidazole ribonucleotide mutase|tara:strand:+ start:432 stop:887 length:456 start_codon:yes stop_codon:yes gene_type:complete